MKNTMIILCVIMTLFSVGYSQSLYGDGHIPVQYKKDWYKAGTLSNITPLYATHIIDISDARFTGSDYNKITQAINEAKTNNSSGGTTVIYFPQGNYYIDQTIELDTTCNNIIFQGEGTGQNVTNLNFSVTSSNRCFYIHGEKS